MLPVKRSSLTFHSPRDDVIQPILLCASLVWNGLTSQSLVCRWSITDSRSRSYTQLDVKSRFKDFSYLCFSQSQRLHYLFLEKPDFSVCDSLCRLVSDRYIFETPSQNRCVVGTVCQSLRHHEGNWIAQQMKWHTSQHTSTDMFFDEWHPTVAFDFVCRSPQ